MTSMIERVARAIAEQNGDDFHAVPNDKPEWTAKRGMFAGRARDINEPFRGDYLEQARAAIEAMREPTAAMEHAYYAACDENGSCLWRHAYRAMIDAALKEQP